MLIDNSGGPPILPSAHPILASVQIQPVAPGLLSMNGLEVAAANIPSDG